jgi:hypothetical protein
MQECGYREHEVDTSVTQCFCTCRELETVALGPRTKYAGGSAGFIFVNVQPRVLFAVYNDAAYAGRHNC